MAPLLQRSSTVLRLTPANYVSARRPLSTRQQCSRWQQRADAVGRRTVLGALAPCSTCNCRNSWYDSYFASNMAHGMQEYEAAVAHLKQQLFKQLFTPLGNSVPTTGVPKASNVDDSSSQWSSSSSSSSGGSSNSPQLRLLEVGVGTGPNFRYYPACAQSTSADASAAGLQLQPSLHVIGLEPNHAMWEYAREAAAGAGLEQQQLQLVAGDAQQMPFESAIFDAAVVTLVLCSLRDPAQALQELLRVLKPTAPLLLIEHVVAPELSWLQVQQRLLDPLQQLLADNCHLTRDTAALVQASGFEVEPLQLTTQSIPAGSICDQKWSHGGLLRFEVNGMGLIAPHVAGILRKAL